MEMPHHQASKHSRPESPVYVSLKQGQYMRRLHQSKRRRSRIVRCLGADLKQGKTIPSSFKLYAHLAYERAFRKTGGDMPEEWADDPDQVSRECQLIEVYEDRVASESEDYSASSSEEEEEQEQEEEPQSETKAEPAA